MNKVATIGTNVVELFQPEGTSEPSGLGCLVIIARHHGLELSVAQLVHDNYLVDQELSVPELLKAARSAGLRAQTVRLDWHGLTQLDKALPGIVRLQNGRSMVLLRLEGGEGGPVRVVLQDPNAGDDALLIIDRVRFESAWTGDVILVRRNYDVREELEPFSIAFVRGLILRERRMVRDIAICAVVLGFLSLMPIVFWQVLTQRVLFYKAFSTFYVLCLAMLVLMLFEAAFFYIRRFLIIHLASRLDVKLPTCSTSSSGCRSIFSSGTRSAGS